MRNYLSLYKYVLCILASLSATDASQAQTSNLFPGAKTVRFSEKQPLRFTLADPLKHPLYWWPGTLLSYPVDFSRAHVKPGQLALLNPDEKNRNVPFQLSEVKTEGGYLVSARLNFFTDLPSGASRTFELVAKTVPAGTAAAPAGVRSYPENDSTLTLTAGELWVQLPSSRQRPAFVPGPVTGVSRNGKDWFGNSRLFGNKKVDHIETTIVEQGELFVTACVQYTFEGGGTYKAFVRVVKGMDFVELEEQMEGITLQDSVYFETSWTGLHPTHRQAPNHPYGETTNKAGFDHFKWEKIDQAVLQYPQGIVPGMHQNEIAFQLGPYQPWHADKMLTSATFWNEKTNNSIGIFIKDISKWQDHEYAIWNSSTSLAIRYFYENKLLSWRWPLLTGTRSTAIACYDHRKDIEAADLAWKQREGLRENGTKYKRGIVPVSHVVTLQNKYGTIDLNKIKDWDLTYSPELRQPETLFTEGEIKSVTELENDFLYNEMTLSLPTTGTCENNGFGPTVSRLFFDRWIDGFNRLNSSMTEPQRKRLTAMYLLMAYVHASEDYMPLKNMLAGHPNFLADVKSIPVSIAFLFPDHPAAETWADEFEKSLELNFRYHTRPAVADWETSGGRWTENLGCYTFAFLRPTIRAAYLDTFRNDKNRLPGLQMGQLADWLVNSLSAPYDGEELLDSLKDKHSWGLVTPDKGPRRVYPPQGAHSRRRAPARISWLLGSYLQNYSPLTAEYLMHVSNPRDDDMDFVKAYEKYDPWKIMFPEKGFNKGTKPPLVSKKYTGYGVMLRAAVDTKDELSIHMQQLDDGPNYRWGIAGNGGSGVLYFYAGGKSYSHNGKEDAGDRPVADTDVTTSFGVFKNGSFRSIGRNVLTSPLVDLGDGQFAELLSKSGSNAGSWPEYQSRSIMLVGSDYFVTYDDVYGEGIRHRFSWFTDINEEFPFIHMLKGGTLKTDLKTNETKGVWYDGSGDCMAVISHKPGLTVRKQPYGAQVTNASGTTDFLFRSDREISYSEQGRSFTGTAGFIRSEKDGVNRLALFNGQQIGAAGVRLEVPEGRIGILASFETPAKIRGNYKSDTAVAVSLQYENGIPAGTSFYIDGEKQQTAQNAKTMTLLLPAGTKSWEVTTSLPVPVPPQILRTEDEPAGAAIFFTEVASAAGYRIEVSTDGGVSWQSKGASLQSPYYLTGLQENVKVHVRVIAFNPENESGPSAIYPVYLTNEAPHAPDGLKVAIDEGKIALTWGEVLGVQEYRLYRRVKGAQKAELIYSGLNRNYTDLTTSDQSVTVYEYTVSSRNKKGEGKPSYPVNSDPATWLNWDPKPGEPFRRRYNYRQSNERALLNEEIYYPPAR